MKYDYDKAFWKAVDKFDFDAAYQCMDAHCWRWWDYDDTPDVEMLVENCQRLWGKVKREPSNSMGSGGFTVGIDEENGVYISFELDVTVAAEEIENEFASLVFDIDFSAVTKAADELERMAAAAERVARSVEGPIEYSSVGDMVHLKWEGK